MPRVLYSDSFLIVGGVQKLFEHTSGMFPELITRTDLSIFLPPIGGCTAYIFGDPKAIPDPSKRLTVRVHDECNGSDVFGSDICTCRPYLIHGIEECIKEAQNGGAGLIVYNRKEGRALGEVTKFMRVVAPRSHLLCSAPDGLQSPRCPSLSLATSDSAGCTTPGRGKKAATRHKITSSAQR